jgi:hypothetical protein
MMTLDAAKRDVCVVQRQTTSTPLQALVLLNDAQYIEAARALAQRAMREGGRTEAERISYAFRLLTSRHPDSREIAILTRLVEQQRKLFRAEPDAARAYLSIGDHQPCKDLDPIELAANSVLVLALMNYDQCVTKR